MFLIKKLCNIKFNLSHHKLFLFNRLLRTVYHKEIGDVTPFLTLNVSLPFNISLEPLDLYKYPNCDKVIVTIEGDNILHDVKCTRLAHQLFLSCDKYETSQATCRIEAPIKASINATSPQGNITLKNFNGKKININTGSGNITATKLYSEDISLTSLTGNIICRTVLQAANIYLSTGKNGNISIDKLLGLNLSVTTVNGDINTLSSYCNQSQFTTESGCLDLHNVHRKCQIFCNEKAKLNLVSFDGNLQACMESGEANIQIARIEGDSKIEIKKEGILKLKLSNECLETSIFRLLAKDLEIREDISVSTSVDNNYKIIKSGTSTTNTLVTCPHSNVVVESLSLKDMFNLKVG